MTKFGFHVPHRPILTGQPLQYWAKVCCRCLPVGYGSKLHQGTTRFSACFHLQGFGYLFLTHSQSNRVSSISVGAKPVLSIRELPPGSSRDEGAQAEVAVARVMDPHGVSDTRWRFFFFFFFPQCFWVFGRTFTLRPGTSISILWLWMAQSCWVIASPSQTTLPESARFTSRGRRCLALF